MTDSSAPVIVWFREELRLADNRALAAAVEAKAPLLALYVFDADSPGVRPLGGASRWWLHHALASLAADLQARGAELTILAGSALKILPEVVRKTGARRVTWSHRYGGAERDIDDKVAGALRKAGVDVATYCDRLLAEPWEAKTQAGDPFRVYSPFYRALAHRLAAAAPAPLAAPRKLQGLPPSDLKKLGAVTLSDLDLLPTAPDWAGGLRETWTPGEAGARARLDAFLSDRLDGYAGGRDRIDGEHTSYLSPHLRFGEISPRQIWAAASARGSSTDRAKFLAELGWREFSYHLLYHHPDLATRNFNTRFDAFPWRRDAKALRAWQRGRTGIPIVDAGMRELWHTGYMHNRVRMIAASFLIKHLLVDWREGERWFWDTLCDADPASNAASWQWVAGSGADAAPYFRVFNPVLQAQKFDAKGDYIRRWVPELAKLAAPDIFAPWEAPAALLDAAGVVIGKTYPHPLIDLGQGRERALAAFAKLPKA